MIPLQLRLKNFLSYQNVILDFRGLHTACICGANGAGKSSLLEAITWVIWGQSRAASDEDIIHTGATDVRVDFEFITNQQCYRIIRTRQRGKNSSLDFQVKRAEEFLSLTGKGIRATQEQIIEAIKLDYDTFINSAYLRQGRADEFMLRPPTQRKQILADLLKLEQYEELATQAKDLSKQYKGQAEQIELTLAGIQQQIAQETEIKHQKQTIEAELKQLQTTQEADRINLQKLQGQEQERKTWEEQLTWQQNKSKNLEQDANRLTQEKSEIAHQLKQYQSLISQEIEIERNYQELREKQKEEETLSNKFQAYQDANQTKQEIEKEILQKNNQLQLKIRQIQGRLDSLEQQEQELGKILNTSQEVKIALQRLHHHRQKLQILDKLQHKVTPLLQQRYSLQTELEKSKANLNAKLEQLNNLEQKCQEELGTIPQKRQLAVEIYQQIQELDNKKVYQKRIQEKTQERNLSNESLKVNQQTYEEKIEELQQKLKLLETPEASCPLCEQNLDEHHRHNVVEKTKRQQQEIQGQIWLIQEQMSVNKKDLKALTLEYQKLENILRNYGDLQQKFGQVESQLDKVGDLNIQLKNIQQEKARIEQLLATETHELNLQKELKHINNKLQELNYDEQTHALVRGEVERWRWAEIKQAKIEDALRNQKLIAQQKPDLIEQIAQLKTEQNTLHSNSDLQQTLHRIEKHLQSLGYDRSHHQKISAYLRQAQSLVINYQKLQEAKQKYPQLQHRLNIIEERLNINIQEQEKIKQNINQLLLKNQAIADNKQALINLDKKIKDQRNYLDNLLAKKGSIEQSLSQIEQFKQRNKNYKEQLEAVRRKCRIYLELTKAFGKNGIQSLMIENVLPQLEAETNQILSRLTGNQLHIQFVTQRLGRGSRSRKKSTKLIDTLDIIIADAQGTRAYETYSGGEAFRINFSVRLALAKLLAQRAGTSLQMLIIDEGFGTQDAEGCERLVAAINAISSDFSCILAVTHMPQFKEAFQHRIEVYKTNQGSQLRLAS